MHFAGAVIIGEKCPYCTKFRSPHDILTYAKGNVKICRDCYEIHLKALEGLSSGRYTGSCSECGKSTEEINLQQGGGDNGVRMAIHFENGIYRPLCLECDRTYVPLRRDLYGDTQFWRAKGF